MTTPSNTLNIARIKQAISSFARIESSDSTLHQRQTDAIYNIGLTAIFSNTVIALLSVLVLWPVTDQQLLVAWLSGLLIINGLRVYLIYLYNRASATEKRATNWLLRYIALTLLTGITWGLIGLFYDSNWPIPYQIFIPLIMSGMSAGAISTNAINYANYLAFIIPLVIPTIAVFIFTLPWPYPSMGYLILIFAIMMLRLAAQFNDNFRESVSLQNSNTTLLGTLKDGNDALVQEMYRRRETEKELRASERLSHSAFELAAIPTVLIDCQGHLIKVNKAVTELSGYTEEQLLGKWFNSLTHPDDKKRSLVLFNKLISGKHSHGELKKRYITRNGDVLWANLSISVVRDEDDKPDYLIAQVVDITEAHALSEELYYQAQYDDLTGLINRREFETRLSHALETVREIGLTHALCYIDLDQFKVINDTCGHTAGDELLRQLAKILTAHTRKTDTLARLGGDEFGLLMEDCNIENALHVADKIRKAVEDFQFLWEKNVYTLGLSIGMIEINQLTYNMTDLLKHVDAACYAAKDAGRNRIHIYTEHDDTLKTRHGEMQWVSRINHAINNDDFILYAQPIVPTCVDKGMTEHLEILLRMDEPGEELISPGAFLPAAERYNLSTKLDRWVTHKVLSGMSRDSRLQNKVIAINLSGPSLCENEFLSYVINQIEDHQVPPSQLCFEITETAAIANLTAATHFITTLNKLGCQFALDDFGSGLSSFAYLKNLPVNYLKIDGVFVRDILDDKIDLAMVKSINEIGHVMGKKTIAEFVENDEVLELLREMGVDYAQGYGVGKPQPFLLL